MATPLKISEAEMSVRAIRRTLVTQTAAVRQPCPSAVTNFYIIIMGGGVVSYFAVVVLAFALLAENCGVQKTEKNMRVSPCPRGTTADVHCLYVLQNDVHSATGLS